MGFSKWLYGTGREGIAISSDPGLPEIEPLNEKLFGKNMYRLVKTFPYDWKIKIDENHYIVNAQLKGSELFRWDFSNNDKYVYRYLKKSIVNDWSTVFGTELKVGTVVDITRHYVTIKNEQGFTNFTLQEIEEMING